MKIGILTFHRANNIGAVLQASALQNFLEEYDDCEIIDFVPNSNVSSFRILKKILHIVKFVVTLPFNYLIYKREKKFKDYRNKYFRLSEKIYYGDRDIFSRPPEYDLLISGSDQIFNMELTGNSLAYYLNFTSDSKKVSYASSFGRKNISEAEKKAVTSELTKFDAISVRERSAGNIIKELINVEPELVLDPVFLITDCWNSRCNEKLSLPEKYIFVYSMENTAVMKNTVLSVKNKYSLPVIFVSGNSDYSVSFGSADKSCGPAEFLRYIRDAEVVVTNSFHGTAFSIIFEKNFICVAHSGRNTRLENIMEIIGEKDKLISDCSNAFSDSIVNGITALEKMDSYIKQSKDYILKIRGCK